MAIPNTTTFSLQNVVDEVNPTTNDLASCIADAIESYYDPAYYTAPATSLLEFRNYKPSFAIYRVVDGFDSESATAQILDINTSDVVIFFVVSTDADVNPSGLGSTSVSDTKGATYTKISGGTYCHVYYTTDVASLGSRTITVSGAPAAIITGCLSITNCTTDVSNNSHQYVVGDTNSQSITVSSLNSRVLLFGSNEIGIISASGAVIASYSNGTTVGSLIANFATPGFLTQSFVVSGVSGGSTEQIENFLIELKPLS